MTGLSVSNIKMRDEKLCVGGFIATSVADGIGIRSVLFLQGCSLNCEGCHNAALMMRADENYQYVSDVVNFVEKNCMNRRLTISGGEPLEQADALKSLVTSLYFRGFDICLYTGKELENVPFDICRYLRYVKTGRYEKDKPTKKRFVGSDNQIMYELSLRGDTLCKEEI